MCVCINIVNGDLKGVFFCRWDNDAISSVTPPQLHTAGGDTWCHWDTTTKQQRCDILLTHCDIV